MSRVIITGGTGLVGKKMAELLKQKGYEPAILTRDPKKTGEYKWDLGKNYIDPAVLEGAHAIIHLSGAGVADKAWTDARKREIIDSRVRSADLLHKLLKNHPHSVKAFISASAVGYYGDKKDKWLTEEMPNGSGFLAEVCQKWEQAADRFAELGLRVCKQRIGIVLSKDGGALPKMAQSLHVGIGTYFGNGEQYLPWIHLEDVCRIFIHSMENENMSGVYNTCAPKPATNKELIAAIAKAMDRSCMIVPAPEFALKLALGERAEMLLMSDRCSSQKIQQSGFTFSFSELDSALKNIYQNK